MDRRVTRSAARQAVSAAKIQTLTAGSAASLPTPSATPAPKRRRLNEDGVGELPHNLGLATTVPSLNSTPNLSAAQRLKNIKGERIDTLPPTLPPISPAPGKGKKSNYGLTPGATPFPDWDRPTAKECEEVNRLLSTVHGEIVPPTTIPEPSLTVTGCGEVPSVLDALIRTLLSGATTGNNSALAFNGLVQKFGILGEGIGKGSVNWDAVRRAPLKEVFEAIKSGGLADIKSKNLKKILDMVHQENQERRDKIVKGKEDTDSGLKGESEGRKLYDVACAEQNFLSLNHLHGLDTQQAMTELMKYPGIGPKTAACVLLFCLQRPCFAVDTHIFRITKWLNWVPPDRATEITAFSHLEVRIPDHLKYSLHQLFIRHGKTCPRCRAITGQSSAGWEDGCVIDHLVTRTGKKKGG
ncbi:DNA glycosylase [Aspergillus ambiguus]|uniref:DNA glycosylase n=1 Tax=Aspergillus ambiguus TaxID=176160 RepID=UPI003CCE1ECD